MQKIKYRISLDMLEIESQVTIKAKKGDTACSVYITLMENGRVYRIADGCHAVFSARKPDGNFLFNSETCRIENNVIIYDFTEQTTPVEGIVECEMALYQNGQKLTSPRFCIHVDNTVYNGEEIESSTEADALKALINEAKKTIDDVNAAKEELNNFAFNNFANAIKNSASGEVVKITDVAPIGDIKVAAYSKNLMPYPYKQSSVIQSNSSFVAQADGGIVASGTPTGFIQLQLYKGAPLLTKGKITISLQGAYTNLALSITIQDGSGTTLYTMNVTESNKSVTISLDEYSTASQWVIALKRNSDNVEMSGIAYPQIELGDTVTNYVPYFDSKTVDVPYTDNNLFTFDNWHSYINQELLVGASRVRGYVEGNAPNNTTYKFTFDIDLNAEIGALNCIIGEIYYYDENYEVIAGVDVFSTNAVDETTGFPTTYETGCSDYRDNQRELNPIDITTCDVVMAKRVTETQVTRYGKNLCNNIFYSAQISQNKLRVYSFTEVTSPTEVTQWRGVCTVVPVKAGQRITVSGNISGNYNDAYYSYYASYDDVRDYNKVIGEHGLGVTTVPEGANYAVIGWVTNKTTGATITFSDVQVEYGTKATTYEPYVEPETFTIKTDGSVNEIPSLYPSVTLVGEAGTTLNVEYNKDINKVIEQLTQAIISLGGNV